MIIRRFLLLLLIILIIAGAGASYYFFNIYGESEQDPNLAAQKEAQEVIAKVDKLIELPKGETPTVATILEKEKLKDQLFFKMGENGDKLLAYNAAMVAILYRPSINKIINVAPITFSQPQNSPQAVTATLRVAYYNGTETAGLAGLAEKTVKEKYPQYQTGTLANTVKKNYAGVLVIDLSGKFAKEAEDLAALLKGRTGVLPEGETPPDADILIITGK